MTPNDTGLTIVPAGAGAGKTYTIQSVLTDWIARGLVRPERILAVTYTEAAASELRGRIRAGLLGNGLVSEALAVERAYVSTIHGLGLRLLTEHAFAAGASPAPRLLGDPERDLLIRQALARAVTLDPVRADPGRFGYRRNWFTGESAEDALRKAVLGMIDLLRGLGDKGRDPALIAPALDRLDLIQGETLADPEAARETLLAAVRAMLDAFPEGGMAGITAKKNVETLEKNLALFRRVHRDPESLDHDWSAWQNLRGLFVSNKSSKTPAGYDDLAQAIIEAADVLPRHPGPLADARLNLECLIACAQEVMSAYADRKRRLGLIDYADMISDAERLLRAHPDILSAVLGEVDCVIIDEFQDTNPVQFSLLWQIGAKAPRTLLVGDVKQSIMGFQGADPRLSAALAEAHPEATKPLDRNWRSTPEVMGFVNAMGAGVFGQAYVPLAPTRPSPGGPMTDTPALEVLNVIKSRGVRKGSKPQEHVAERIARLLAGGEQISDRRSGEIRAARPSDIALLVCRHTTAASYAEELRARGVPVRISEEGWSASPVVEAARAALSYAANPDDLHAGLVFRVLGPDALDLEVALSRQIDGLLAEDPALMRLAALADRIGTIPVADALALVVDAAGLRAWFPDYPAQSRADLMRLLAEAEAFDAAHRDLKAAAGFHGGTAKVFLGWLDARMAERDFDRHPDPAADTSEAVEIVTWHASKGREWPITVVAEFDNKIAERAGTTSVRFEALDRIADMRQVLASARLVHTPTFDAPEVRERFIEDRRPDFEANARNLLYVALTRARDRLVLEWPGFLKERDEEDPAQCLFHVFEDDCRPAVGKAVLKVNGTECPASVIQCPEEAQASELAGYSATGLRLMGGRVPLDPVEQTPWRVTPSGTAGAAGAPAADRIPLGEPWPGMANTAARGTAIHQALHCLLVRPDLAPALEPATGLDAGTLALVAQRAAELKAWLSARGFTELRGEIPVLLRTDTGAEISGTIDLLAIGSRGCLLVDHKTGGAGEGFGPYWPQLEAYIRVVRKVLPDRPVLGAAIHWVDHGALALAGMAAMQAQG